MIEKAKTTADWVIVVLALFFAGWWFLVTAINTVKNDTPNQSISIIETEEKEIN